MSFNPLEFERKGERFIAYRVLTTPVFYATCVSNRFYTLGTVADYASIADFCSEHPLLTDEYFLHIVDDVFKHSDDNFTYEFVFCAFAEACGELVVKECD